MPQSVKTLASEIGADQYAICGNGTLIYDLQKEEVIYDAFMEKEKVLNIISLCEENSIYYNIYTETEVITKSLSFNTLFYDKENSKKPIEKRTNINIVENPYEYMKNREDLCVLKMTICDSDKVIFSSILRKLKTVSKIDILEVEHMSRKNIRAGTEEIPVEYYYTEIAKKNTNKWTAIEFLIDKLKINKEEVMAIGDNRNDQEMIENAGLGVAMGNSMLSSKKIGDVFVRNNDENGVAQALNEFINSKKK